MGNGQKGTRYAKNLCPEVGCRKLAVTSCRPGEALEDRLFRSDACPLLASSRWIAPGDRRFVW